MTEHIDVQTRRPYADLGAAFEKMLGHWPPATAEALVQRGAPWDEVRAAVTPIAGSLGLMIIAAINQGALTSLSGKAKRCRLYLIGNPLIATHILDADPRAAFYVPFRVCIYAANDTDGAHICYDKPSSSLAALGRPDIDAIGADLDAKIGRVVAMLTHRATAF
jgi:uncharacterized protein (DUF302 family)